MASNPNLTAAQPNWANLDGGRYLADLYNKDSVQAAFMQKMINAINTLGSTLGANPVGDVQPPPPIDNVNVSASGELLQLTLNHNKKVNRNINYFAEIGVNDPSFTQPLVLPLGPSRSPAPFSLPTNDSTGNPINYYVRAYAQYFGSKPSKVTTFGGALNPASIQMGGSTKMTVLSSTGSGTASPTGQQGGSGFGKVLVAPKVVGSEQASIGPATSVIPVIAPSNVPVFVGDCVDHGSCLWEADPGYVEIRDDFWASNTTISTSVLLGQTSWEGDNQGSAAWTIRQGIPPLIGVWHVFGNTSAGKTSAGCLGTDNANQTSYAPLFDYPSWKVTFVFQFVGNTYSTLQGQTAVPSFNQKSFYIGLANSGSSQTFETTWGRFSIFCGLRFDKDPTSPAISDSTFHFECVANTIASSRNNTQGNVVDTGVTPALNTPYRLDIICTAAGAVQMSLNGSTPVTVNMPTYSGGGSGENFSVNDGVAFVGCSGAWNAGSQVAVSVPSYAINVPAGTYTNLYPNTTGVYVTGTGTVDDTLTSTSVIGYPCVVPAWTWGNDTESSPANDIAFQFDFFSFLWNPGVNPTNTLVADPTLARYWPS